MNDLYVCLDCKSIGTPYEGPKVSQSTELLLWTLLIVPGALYRVWRLIKKWKSCPVCSSREVVPMNSSRGIRFLNRLCSNRNTRIVQTVLNYDEDDLSVFVPRDPGKKNHELMQ